jgi:hypothetical protein
VRRLVELDRLLEQRQSVLDAARLRVRVAKVAGDLGQPDAELTLG